MAWRIPRQRDEGVHYLHPQFRQELATRLGAFFANTIGFDDLMLQAARRRFMLDPEGPRYAPVMQYRGPLS